MDKIVKNQYDRVLEQNKSLQKDIRLLQEMLHVALKAMHENELCSYCSKYNNCNGFENDDICLIGLANGLEDIVIK